MVKHTLAGLQGREDLQSLAQDAKDRLRSLVDSELKELTSHFLGKAQEHLAHQDDRKAHEWGRQLKQRQEEWNQYFLNAIEQRLFSESEGGQDAPDVASASMISMAKSMLLAESRYFKIIAEISARINRIDLIVDLPVNIKALAPTGLNESILRTAEAMKAPPAMRDMLLSVFDQQFIARLEPLYQKVMNSLRDIGAEAARLVVESQTVEETAARVAPERKKLDKEKWMRPPEDQLKVDETTSQMLTRLALESDGDGYTDGLLAADLLALMDRRPLPGIAKEQGWVPVQRTSLAGHFLNEAKADPIVPRDDDSQHETLRMPLVKSAIADSSVFTDASHPLASLIDEHMTKAARHRLQNREESEEMMDSLQEILNLFDLSPDFVRESMSSAKPLEDAQIKRFYELQRQQAAQRREFVVNEAKRIVAEEVERSCFGRDVPAPAERFLNKVWGALMTQTLLKFGASDERWNLAIGQMDELIDLLEARNPKEAPPEEWVSLIKDMIKRLAKGGLPEAQRAAVLKMLEAARRAS